MKILASAHLMVFSLSFPRKIEKYRDDVEILLNCLTKLEKVRVNISLLQV